MTNATTPANGQATANDTTPTPDLVELLEGDVLSALEHVANDLAAILVHEHGGSSLALDAEGISVGEAAVRANYAVSGVVQQIRRAVSEIHVGAAVDAGLVRRGLSRQRGEESAPTLDDAARDPGRVQGNPRVDVVDSLDHLMGDLDVAASACSHESIDLNNMRGMLVRFAERVGETRDFVEQAWPRGAS